MDLSSVSPVSSQWTCPACTLHNEASAQTCAVCDTPKPMATQLPLASLVSPSPPIDTQHVCALKPGVCQLSPEACRMFHKAPSAPPRCTYADEKDNDWEGKDDDIIYYDDTIRDIDEKLDDANVANSDVLPITRTLEHIETDIDNLCAQRPSCTSKDIFAAQMLALLDERSTLMRTATPTATMTPLASSADTSSTPGVPSAATSIPSAAASSTKARPSAETDTMEHAAVASADISPPTPEGASLMRQLSDERRSGAISEAAAIQLKKLCASGDVTTVQTLLDATLEQLQRECEICFSEFRKNDMCQIACSSSHTYCWDCAQEVVKENIQNQVIPKCPGFDECQHQLTGPEVKYVLGRGQYETDGVIRGMASEWDAYNRYMTTNALAKNANMVSCPKCEYPVECELPKAVPQKVTCPRRSCRHVYCSACTRLYHYQVDCTKMRILTLNWHDWIQNGRQKFLTEVAKVDKAFRKYAKAKRKYDKEMERRIKRHAELVEGEKLLAERCRLCPNCGKPVEKLEGCDYMKCGRDYHGGNNQAGCGADFNWNEAKPYVASAGDFKAMDPFEKIEPQHASRSVHFIDSGRSHQMNCDICCENIVGPRFSCVHCPGDKFNICFRCEAQISQLDGGLHDPEHVFMIHMGDSVAGVDWSGK